MFKKWSILAALTCAFAFAGVVLADQPKPAPAMHPKSSIMGGGVISVSAAARQIVVKNSEGKMENVTFDVADKANIRKGGKAITLSDIAAGDKVLVAFKQKDDKRTATTIKVRNPKTGQ